MSDSITAHLVVAFCLDVGLNTATNVDPIVSVFMIWAKLLTGLTDGVDINLELTLENTKIISNKIHFF